MSQIAIFAGTVYGSAQFVAEEMAQSLTDGGHDATFIEQAELDAIGTHHDTLVVCTSTTGSGDIPDNLQPFVTELKNGPDLSALRFAVVALGDSSYLDSFCGAGHTVHAALEDCGAEALSSPLEIDACEVDTPEDVALPWVEDLLKP
ncbi:MAG: flavodoxin domain-containing protein [Pseudomonadota bacterium]